MPKHPPKPRYKTYPEVGRCIYCGATGPDVDLSEEHIVAYGLGGRMTLPKASCATCAKETGRIETAVLQIMWEPIRTHLAIPSRKKRKRPTHLPVWVKRGGKHELENIPVEDHPWMLFMHAFENMPGLLVGKPEGHGGLKGKIFQIRAGDGQERISRLGTDVKGVRIKQRTNLDYFVRMLAKIAHAYASAEIGIERFEPFLPPLILAGKKPFPASHLVGGRIEQAPLARSLHEIDLQRTRVTNKRQSIMAVEDFWVAKIRLFANLGGPDYYVVVGKPR